MNAFVYLLVSGRFLKIGSPELCSRTRRALSAGLLTPGGGRQLGDPALVLRKLRSTGGC